MKLSVTVSFWSLLYVIFSVLLSSVCSTKFEINDSLEDESSTCGEKSIPEKLQSSTCPAEYYSEHVPKCSLYNRGRIIEMNETQLNLFVESITVNEKDLNNQANETDESETYTFKFLVVLYYAKWCPFSQEFIPELKALAENNPSVLHVAVEEQDIRLSSLSKISVHSFPAIFVYNESSKVRYTGKRYSQDLQSFYSNITGQIKVSSHASWQESTQTLEQCPYKWAKHPESIFQENVCLIFSLLFVIGRLAFWAIPYIKKIFASEVG